jgi:proline dehydrogenase
MKLPFFLARRFVAGETLDEALPAVRDLNTKGLHVALDLLGEHVRSREVATAACDRYVDLVHTLAEHTGRQTSGQTRNGAPRNRISIKLSMLGQLIDEDFCLGNLRRVLDAAATHDMFVRLDMEGSDLTQSTLDLFEAVYPDYAGYVGPVLQAMLKRTRGDVARMCDLGASVRLCKGAYAEPPATAHQNMDVIRARFLDYAQQLLQYTHYSGIATHDDRLIRGVKAFAQQERIDAEQFEFQMLYGLRHTTQVELAKAGYNTMVYVPYGTEWFPYFARRLRERKENVFFVMRNLVRE